MKKILSLLIITLSIGLAAYAKEKSPTAKLCKILKIGLSRTHGPKELCDKFNGSFCDSMKSFGQGVCAANGKSFCDTYKSDGEALCEAEGGSFCSSVKTLAGGICSILGESFCDTETDEEKWKRKLSEACYW